jgi:microcin C transport system substrate-binding protein
LNPLIKIRKSLKAVVVGSLVSVAFGAMASEVTKTWAMAEFGEPLYEEGIEHWPYVNPNAPKGGSVVLGAFGTFDSLNSYILKGTWPRSIGLIGDSLMVSSADELASAYGVIAESAEFPEDLSWIIFNIRPEAKYDNGTPITAYDFEYSLQIIREFGRPFLQSFYEEVTEVEVLSEHRIKFSFSTTGTMKPLMTVAGMSPLSVEYWKDKDISKTYLEPGPASGAYRISKVDAGRSITYERVENYWGRDLPVNRGLNNYDEIRYDYYRDLEVMLEAFKAGEIDYREENSSKRWATAYEIEEVTNGEMILDTPPDNQPQGIQAFMLNTRRAPFDDQRVRRALNYLYDFEATKRTILYNQYERINSYFPNSDYGASGPPTAEEIAILEPYRDQLPAELFTEAYVSPVTDGSGRNRAQMREAIKLFKEAGWSLENGKLMKDGEQMKVELLLVDAGSQRVHALLVQNMKKAGIDAEFRIVDSSQYEVRMDDFDFDMVSVRFNFFPPPGAELRSYYGSGAADERGTGNYTGIKNPIVDELIEKIVVAPSLDELKVITRALDRVLLWNDYVIPQFYNGIYRLAYWNRFGKPATASKYGTGFLNAWWIDESLDSKLDLDR